MNRILTLSGVVLIAGSVSAQGQVRNLPEARKTAVQAVSPPLSTHATTSGAARGGSNCIFSEDFENVTTLTELTDQGWNTGPEVEQAEDQDNGAGLGTFVPAWRIGDAAATSSTYVPIPDIPAGNHLIVANDDGEPCNCIMDSVVLVTPSIDFSGQTDMSVAFRGFSDERFGGGQMKVFASRNGGTEWEEVYTVAPVQATLQSIVVDLSAFDGEPDVKIAWKWSDETAWATGIAVDDICVAPILDNNLTLQRVYSADVTVDPSDLTLNSLEYTYMPLEQAQPLDIAVSVINNGGLEQTNVVATATVTLNGNPVDTYMSAPTATLARSGTDTIVIHTGYVPTEAGELLISVTVAADQTDDFAGDNDGESSIRFTDTPPADLYSTWGRDHNAAESFGGGTDLFRVANLLEVVNSGSIAYGVEVAFGDADPGVIVHAQLLDAGTADFDPVMESDDFTVLPEHQNDAGGNVFTYIPFTEPYPLTANTEVMPCLVGFGGANVRYANSGSSPDQTTFVYGDGSQGITWYYTTATAMVRLMLASVPVGVEELVNNSLTLGGNVPNPFNDNTTIQYQLSDARRVSITVTDVDGKVVLSQDLGMRGSGRYAYDIDATDLASGIYSYTLTAGEDRLTRRMIVAK